MTHEIHFMLTLNDFPCSQTWYLYTFVL